MKKILGLSLVAATVLVGTMNAADEAGLSGDVRAMMHHGGQSYGKKADSSATAVSVASNIVYSSEKKNGMKFNIGFSVQGNVLDIGVENGQNSADEQSIDDNFINNILNAEIDTNAGTLIVGRQILDTPMAGPDDSRLVPDTFEAMTLVNTTAVADVTLIASQVTAMAGWDSPSLSTYTSMTSQLGTATEANGVTVLAAIYGKDALSASIYSYNIFNTTDTSGTTELNPISLNYLDAGYALDMGGMKINLAGQFEFLSATQTSSTAGVKDVDLGYTVFGAQADLALDMGLTLTGAFNSVTANDDFDSLFALVEVDKGTEIVLVDHKVRSGESLWLIAKKYNVRIQDIVAINKMQNARYIRPGQLLRIPMNGYKDTIKEQNENRKTYYTVRGGDTLSEIAEKNRTSVRNLKKWNGLRGDFIRVGQKLIIWKKA